MKKVIFLIFLIFLIIFALPIFFTNPFESEEVASEEAEFIDTIEPYDYGNYTDIRLLHADTGEVESLSLDEYLLGVVSAEMPATYELEALKSQAIVARTYTIFKIRNGSKHQNVEADICDNSNCCQAWISKENRMARWDIDKKDEYWKKIFTAVSTTTGKVIMYNGEPINAFFHSNSGGKTETPINVWRWKLSVSSSGRNIWRRWIHEL